MMMMMMGRRRAAFTNALLSARKTTTTTTSASSSLENNNNPVALLDFFCKDAFNNGMMFFSSSSSKTRDDDDATRLNEMVASSSSFTSSSTLPLIKKKEKNDSTTTREKTTTHKKFFSTSAQSRIGQKGIPDEYGQPKTGGTSFLGTPENHRELLSARPLSPDVLDVDGKSAHYNFPIVALSSITNRITGCVLSGAVGVGGVVACAGGPEAVPETVEMFKTQFPMLVFPVKAALSFPFVYHGVAGMRHLVWDMSAFGIDNENAKKSSMFVFASSVVGAAAMASSSF